MYCGECQRLQTARYVLPQHSYLRSARLGRRAAPDTSISLQCRRRTLYITRGNGPLDSSDRSLSSANETINQLPWRWEQSDDALRAYILFFGLLSLGQLPALRAVKFAELPYFLGLACLTIYIGAHRGLTSKIRQQISLQQGAFAPLFASAALFGGFLLIKYLPWLNLQTVCNIYFWCIGCGAVTGALAPPLRQAVGSFGTQSLSLPVPKGLFLDDSGESVTTLEVAPTDVLALLIGLAAASLDLAANHQNFTFNNLVACLICSDILQLIGLRSFRAATVLLFGLLAYDVFWVFGSPSVVGENVMLTVATSDLLIGPTKILFPRFVGSVGEASNYPFSLLGLGDIAIPGLLACLALRFDSSKLMKEKGLQDRAVAAADAFSKSLASSKQGDSRRESARAAADAASEMYDRVADSSQGSTLSSAEQQSEGMPNAIAEILQSRSYFISTMVAYVGGLGLAFGINAVTHMGQPALLYLVPCCLGSVTLVSAIKGDLGTIYSFTDTTSTSLLPKPKESD